MSRLFRAARSATPGHALAEATVGAVAGAARHTSAAVQRRVAELIADQLHAAVQTSAGQAVYATATKAVVTTASASIVHSVAVMLMKLLALHLKTIVIKVLASAAAKTLIAAAVKKYVLAAVLATVVKAIAVKLGIAAGSVWIWILLPVIAAFIAYEVVTFPGHLGEKVGSRVAAELGDSFDKITENVVSQIVRDFAGTGVGQLGALLGQDPGVRQQVGGLLADMM